MIKDIGAAQGQSIPFYKMYQEKIEQVDAHRDLFFTMLTLEYGITSNQNALNWLNSVLRRLESGNYSPQR